MQQGNHSISFVFMIKITKGIFAFSITLNSRTKSSLCILNPKVFSLEKKIISCIQSKRSTKGILVFYIGFFFNLFLSIFLLYFSSAKNSLYFTVLSKEAFRLKSFLLEKPCLNSSHMNLICLIEENLLVCVISILCADRTLINHFS